jgi:hypothetical protein
MRPRTGGRHDGAVAAVLAVSRRRPSEVLRAPRRAPAHAGRRGGATTAPPLPALAPSEGSAGDAASHSSSAGLRHALQNSYEMPKGLTVLLQLWILDLQDGHRSPRHQFCSSAHRSSLNSSLRLRSIPFSTFIDRSEETGRAAGRRGTQPRRPREFRPAGGRSWGAPGSWPLAPRSWQCACSPPPSAARPFLACAVAPRRRQRTAAGALHRSSR